jgi:hypothetical protein
MLRIFGREIHENTDIRGSHHLMSSRTEFGAIFTAVFLKMRAMLPNAMEKLRKVLNCW